MIIDVKGYGRKPAGRGGRQGGQMSLP